MFSCGGAPGATSGRFGAAVRTLVPVSPQEEGVRFRARRTRRASRLGCQPRRGLLMTFPWLQPVPAQVLFVQNRSGVAVQQVLASRTGGSVGGWSRSESSGTGPSDTVLPGRPSRQVYRQETTGDLSFSDSEGTVSVQVPTARGPRTGNSFPWEIAIFGSVIAASTLKSRGDRTKRGISFQPGSIAVARLLVALRGEARDFVRPKLQALAAELDTTQPRDLCHLLRDATLLLERARETGEGWYASAHDVLTFDASEESAAESSFRRMSVQIKANWREDTVLNLDGVRRIHSDETGDANNAPGEETEPDSLLVVALLVAIRNLTGVARSSGHVLEALHGVTEDDLLAVEVLWTPDRPNDTLTEEDMIAQFPELVRLSVAPL